MVHLWEPSIPADVRRIGTQRIARADEKQETFPMVRKANFKRIWPRFALVFACMWTIPLTTCWDTDISKRFREVSGPGVISGFSSILTDPTVAETGLRSVGTSLLDGFGAIISPRTPSGGG